MHATQAVGIRPINNLLQVAVAAETSRPFLYWPMAVDEKPLYGGTASGMPDLPTLTGTGSPSYATRAGWLTLDDTSYYTSTDFANAQMARVFDLQEGILLVSFQATVASGATGQNKVLSLGAGGAPALWIGVSTATSYRPDVAINFDGDTAGTPPIYAGASNEFAAATDTNITLLIDNRPAVKGLSRFVNGTSVTGATWAGKGALSWANMTGRWRIGADAAGTAASTFNGAFRRLLCVNFGTTMPSNINGLIQSLHQSNCRPTRELYLAAR